MEKSSFNIKHFWNVFSRGSGKSYTIPREDTRADGKFVNGTIINNVTNGNAENVYPMRYHKSKNDDDNGNGCDRRRRRSRGVSTIFTENVIKCQRIYNNNFCLPIFTPISCR